MSATTELLDALAAWVGGDSPASDYHLAKHYFHLSPQKVSQWRTGKFQFADEKIIRICEDIWPGDDEQKARWLLQVHADREQNVQVREVWQRLAKSVAAAVIVASLGVAAPQPAEATTSKSILCQIRRFGPKASRREKVQPQAA